MSRRGVPLIVPSDLRDHADEARVERIWEHVERDLAAPRRESQRRSSTWMLALAATLGAFAGGIFVGRGVDGQRGSDAAVVAVASSDAVVVDVLAAGSEGRTYPLPDGAWIALAPGATIELERGQGSSFALHLVQGEATLNTASGTGTPVDLIAGDARVSAQAGSAVSVRRDRDVVDVRVTDGSVDLQSSAGTRRLGRGEIEAVPLRPLVDAPPVASAPHALPRPVARAPRGELRDTAPPSAAGTGWRGRYATNDWAGAYVRLNGQSGGVNAAIDAAGSASELMAISDLARGAGDQTYLRALTAVSERFPGDANAQVANYTLGEIYDRAGQGALAQKYREQAAQSSNGLLAEDAYCKLLRAEAAQGHKEEAARMAAEYGVKYPDGRCKEEAERIARGEVEAPGPTTDDDVYPNAGP